MPGQGFRCAEPPSGLVRYALRRLRAAQHSVGALPAPSGSLSQGFRAERAVQGVGELKPSGRDRDGWRGLSYREIQDLPPGIGSEHPGGPGMPPPHSPLRPARDKGPFRRAHQDGFVRNSASHSRRRGDEFLRLDGFRQDHVVSRPQGHCPLFGAHVCC